jgi:hypothetical protein
MKKFESFSKDKTPNRTLNFNSSEFENALKEIRASEPDVEAAPHKSETTPPEPSISENSTVIIGEATFPSVSSQTDIEDEPSPEITDVEAVVGKREGCCQTDDIDLESLDPLDIPKPDDKSKVTSSKAASTRPAFFTPVGQRAPVRPMVGRGRAMPMVPSSPQPRAARSVSDAKVALSYRTMTKRPIVDLKPRPTTAPAARTVSLV